MKLIVAVDKNWSIGHNNKLLVSIPEDMKFFRSMTTNKVVVMGRKTLESFPNKKPLPNRTNIIITRDGNYIVDNATVVHSIEEALEEIKKYNSEDVICIGGDSIYNQMLPYCDEAFVTYINYEYNADAKMPNLDKDKAWKLVEESEEQTYFDLEYFFRRYKRQ